MHEFVYVLIVPGKVLLSRSSALSISLRSWASSSLRNICNNNHNNNNNHNHNKHRRRHKYKYKKGIDCGVKDV